MIAKHLENDLPVEYHETFDVVDSSKIQCFMDCPRKFFFRYVLGWTSEEPNIHLVFGSAWHEAMEHFMNNGLKKEQIFLAFDKLRKKYKEEYPNEFMEPDHYAKNLDNGLEALGEYARQWRPVDEFDTLYTEISGSVPITEEILLFVKLDTIVRETDGSIWSMEHKTTGRKTQSWMNKWTSKIQTGSYSHFLNILYPDDFEGIKINGSILRKKNNEFLRIPVRLNTKQMNQWLWEVRHWVEQIRWNYRELAKASKEDDVLRAFPRNTESCCKFGCDHPELCNLMSNPLRRMEEPPLGYKKEFWDPRKRDKSSKAVAHLKEEKEIKEKEQETETGEHHSNE